eukprot:8701027-Pyramimonas_sp.AAC.1
MSKDPQSRLSRHERMSVSSSPGEPSVLRDGPTCFFLLGSPGGALPNTTCFPSRWLVFSVQRKNWEPLVLGPELAMERIP